MVLTKLQDTPESVQFLISRTLVGLRKAGLESMMRIADPKVRIHSPPAESQQTFGSARGDARMQQRFTIPPTTLDLYNTRSAEVPHNGAAHQPGRLLVLAGEVVFADRSPHAVKNQKAVI
jgi:hypothetical protein